MATDGTEVNANDPFAGNATNKSGGSYELIPADNYPANLIGIIDLGTHDGEYKKQPRLNQRFFCLAFELSGEKLKNGDTPYLCETVSVFLKDGVFQYTGKNKLRLILESMRGKAYGESEPVKPLAALGKGCMVNVKHGSSAKGNDFAKIDSISKLAKGTQAPPCVREPFTYFVTDASVPDFSFLPFVWDNPAQAMMSINAIIDKSKEHTGEEIKSESAPASPSASADNSVDDDEDIPF